MLFFNVLAFPWISQIEIDGLWQEHRPRHSVVVSSKGENMKERRDKIRVLTPLLAQ